MTIDADMQAEFASLGATVPVTAIGDDVFEVWTSNKDALDVFLGVSTQWRFLTVNNRPFRSGLDYTAVEAVMRQYKIRKKSMVFADVQVMERAAIDTLFEVNA